MGKCSGLSVLAEEMASLKGIFLMFERPMILRSFFMGGGAVTAPALHGPGRIIEMET